jgi:PAS domain-containing protein
MVAAGSWLGPLMAEQLPEGPRGRPMLYRALIEASSEAVLGFEDGSARCALANAAAERLLGYRPNELLGLRLADLSAPGDVARLPAIVERLERRGEWRGDGARAARTAALSGPKPGWPGCRSTAEACTSGCSGRRLGPAGQR